MVQTNDTRVKVPASILTEETTSSIDETNDIDALNPHGRVPVDSGEISKKPNFFEMQENCKYWNYKCKNAKKST
jgi:hypothetical protein